MQAAAADHLMSQSIYQPHLVPASWANEKGLSEPDLWHQPAVTKVRAEPLTFIPEPHPSPPLGASERNDQDPSLWAPPPALPHMSIFNPQIAENLLALCRAAGRGLPQFPHPPEHWTTSGDVFSCHGWRWGTHLVGGGQGCCQTSFKTQDKPYST
jgi:hypothetical protein